MEIVMPYFLMIAGLITMCVPEEAGLLRMFLQGGFGLAMFGLGTLIAIDENSASYQK
jgi:hypothetical protein